jgi:hypothetical protein
MAEFKLSRLKFTWKGAWSPVTQYIKDDVVSYGAKTYVCLEGHTSVSNFYDDLNKIETATEPDTPDPQWELMFDGYEWRGDWFPSTFYKLGDIVKYNGIVYICIDPHTSDPSLGLEFNQLDWVSYARGDKWKNDWTPSTNYSVNDIVKYFGILYRCTQPHLSDNTFLGGLESNELSWEVLTPAQAWRTNWAVATRYRKNDIVKYGAFVYRCVVAHVSANTLEAGLELDLNQLDSALSKWEIVHEGIDYKFSWLPGTKYKLNDVVKYGASTWICTEYHTSLAAFDDTKFQVFLPGYEYEEEWSTSTVYQKGDVIKYGGYAYTALINNIGANPRSSPIEWELLTKGFKIMGEWQPAVTYNIGDVLRRSGQIYVAVTDTSSDPNDPAAASEWELVVPGEKWYKKWAADQNYAIGDTVVYIANTYRCVKVHLSTTLNRPNADINEEFWTTLIAGDPNNSLQDQGDLKIFGATSVDRVAIGTNGQTLSVNNTAGPSWDNFGQTQQVYFVGPDGIDSADQGITLESPFASIRYACGIAVGPATIFVKAGLYREILPISIPAGVALVGEELRSTVVEPLPGYETLDMFYVRNGTGIRNLTVRGLNGTLGPLNQYITRRPTAGAYVSLDPGNGSNDSAVWITTRSPYIQNVTTFGNGCVGLKVDGSLHGGGNRSIVANDFTQILSDGIGAWVTNNGLSELVSVFSYYAHIGYLAENGGKIRATNGNSSYGTYGTVAEGVNDDEIPLEGVINNRTRPAQIATAFSGEANDEILKLEFTNAGENYTTATYTFVGSGINAAVIADEFRDGAVFETRILDPINRATSSLGGGGYINTGNNAQAGDPFTITLATNDPNDISTYRGLRVIIQSGSGTGQYGYIVGYDSETSKIANVANEYFQALTTNQTSSTNDIITVANTETLYVDMPVYIDFNPVNLTTVSTSVDTDRITVSSTAGLVVGMPIVFVNPVGNIAGATVYYIKTIPTSTTIQISETNNGSVYSLINSAIAIRATAGGTFGGLSTQVQYYVVADNFSSTTFSLSTSVGGTPVTLTSEIGEMTIHQAGWSHVNSGTPPLPLLDTTSVYRIESRPIYSDPQFTAQTAALGASSAWVDGAYGDDKFVIISSTGSTVYGTVGSFNSGSLPAISGTWNAITYANGLFVASSNGENVAASSDGIVWFSYTVPGGVQNWASIAGGNDIFVTVSATSGTAAAYANSTATTWTDSTLPSSGIWTAVAYGAERFVALRAVSDQAAVSTDGITWTAVTLPYSATWTSIVYGNGRFVAMSAGDQAIYSFDGSTWYTSRLPIDSSWRKISYGQGVFVAIASSSTDKFLTSSDGVYWTIRTAGQTTTRWSVVFGNPAAEGDWLLLPPTGSTIDRIKTGATTRGRLVISGGKITAVRLWEPGSGYLTPASLTIIDPNNNSDVNLENRIGNGALGNPTFLNRGIGYKTSTTRVTVSGDGYADIYPVDGNIILDNVARVPRTGANLILDEIRWTETVLPLYTWAPTTENDWSLAFGLIADGSTVGGVGQFVAIAGYGTGGAQTTVAAYSTDGVMWTPTSLPASALWKEVIYGEDTFLAIAANKNFVARSVDGVTWTQIPLPVSANWSAIGYGNGTYVIVGSGTSQALYSLDQGLTWIQTALPISANYIDVKFGGTQFLAIATGSTISATSSNGINWQSRTLPQNTTWSKISYGKNRFVLTVTNGDLIATSLDFGVSWNEYSLPSVGDWTSLVFTGGRFVAARSDSNIAATSINGEIWKARTTPTPTAALTVGNEILVAWHSIAQSPSGGRVSVSTASDGTTDTIYRVLTVSIVNGIAPNYRLALRVSPTFNRTTTPIHATGVEIREKYSQVRLTGHDFLDIGSGNFTETNYPNVNVTNLQPDKETYARAGGRVFYTSTDQDGNFRVGELFAVEQATGVVTISADFFDLSGLTELRLGGIRVGGTGVVIREFSTDATFTADSNNIIPTQRAIKAFIARRISGGGSDAATGRLVAGTVFIGPQSIGNTTGIQNIIPVVMNFKRGIDGVMLAQSFFSDSFNSGLDFQEVGRDLA